MALLYSDFDINTSLSSSNRNDPEKTWSNNLFKFGLFVEAVAILYSVGFAIPIGFTKDGNGFDLLPIYLYQEIRPLSAIVCLVALLSLLVHQNYIKKHFRLINKVTCELDTNQKVFPTNLMYSKIEYYLRICFFILIAVIAGEIPYLLIVIEKVFMSITHSTHSTHAIHSNAVTLFVFACSILCLVVLVWDIIVYVGFVKINNPTLLNENKTNYWTFIISDGLSMLLWGFIIAFMLTKEPHWIDTWVTIIAFFYSFWILVWRGFIKPRVNIQWSGN